MSNTDFDEYFESAWNKNGLNCFKVFYTTRLWPVLRRDNFSVYVICARRIIFNNLYDIYQWYLDNASHSPSQSLLITRATALITILRIFLLSNS